MSMGGGGLGPSPTVYISGNASGVRNAAQQANTALASLTNTVTQNWFGVQNLGLAFAALPTAVAAGAGAAIKAAIDWEDALFSLQRATGGTKESAAAIGDEILEVARRVPLATTELAELAATAAQLGVEDVAKFAEVFGTLISATNLTEANVGDFARVINVMQVPERDFDRFANTLLEVGRNTAATESEILNITRRMSGAAAVAGFTSDQLLGLGAAVISLGPRAEAGATALNKTINDITRAIGTNSEDLENWAAVAGMSVEGFTTMFRDDAAKAVAAFVSGLARLQGGGESQIAVLDALGITEARQVAALQQLAQGTLDVGNEQRDLNAILGFTATQWQTSNATADIAAAKAKTLSGQIQLLKNALFEFGAGIGKFMTGPLGFVIQRILDFLAGVQALPLPLKLLMAALFLTVTAIMAVAAAALLIGPRILIAADAFRRLRNDVTGSVPAVVASTAALNANAAAATRAAAAVAAASGSYRNASGQLVSRAFEARKAAEAASTAGIGVAAATGTAATGIGKFAAMGGKFLKVAGWITAALTVLSIATTIFGNRQRKAQEQAEKALAANDDLVSIMRQQNSVIGSASQIWLEQQQRYQRAAAAAQQLGFDLAVLNRIIQGQGSPQDMDTLVQSIKNGGDAGREMGRDILALATIWENSADAAGVQTQAVSESADAEVEAAEAARTNNEALKEQVKLLEAVAQAHIDLADAVNEQRGAALDLADAQQAYTDAQSEASQPARAMRRAELDLAQARFDAADAQRDLADAEKDIAEARARGARRAADAEDALADAHDRYADSQDKIVELEERLEEIRTGPSLRELRDATNDLRNAELKLARAHQKVGDAEWYLQHLREEGASERDIEDAEMAIAEARQEVEDDTADVADAEKELNDLRDVSKWQRELAALERDLAATRRDAESATREIAEREEELADARLRVVEDRDYIEAQQDIVDAQQAVEQALLDTQKAEQELDALRNGRLERDAARASMDLESAIIGMAQANVEVRRQQALANGETWDAGDAAHALADELQSLMGLAPDASAAGRLQRYIDTLRAAPNVPDAPDDSSGLNIEFNPEDYGLPSLGDVGSYLDELNRLVDGAGEDTGGGSIWEQIWEAIGGGAQAGALAGGAIGTIFGPGGTIVGGIVGSLVGGIIGGLIEHFWPEISGFFIGAGEMLGRNIPNWFGNIGRFFAGIPGVIGRALSGVPGAIGGAFNSAMGAIGSFIVTAGAAIGGFFSNLPYTVGFAMGSLVGTVIRGFVSVGVAILGFIGTQGGNLLRFFTSLPSRIGSALLALPGLLGSIFTTSGLAMFNNVTHYGGQLLSWFLRLPGQIGSALASLPGWIFNTFTNIGLNLWNGFWNNATRFASWFANLGTTIWNWIKDVPGQVAGWFADLGRGLWDGFWGAISGSPHSKIEYALWDIEDTMSGTVKSMRQNLAMLNGMTVDPFADTMKKGFSNVGIEADYLSGMLDDMAAPRAAFAASPAGVAAPGAGNTYHETLNLEAITTADPTEIINEYVWAKRVRLRGGV